MHLGDSERNQETFHWQHLLAWLGGILCAMVPFLGAWEIGAMQTPVTVSYTHLTLPTKA